MKCAMRRKHSMTLRLLNAGRNPLSQVGESKGGYLLPMPKRAVGSRLNIYFWSQNESSICPSCTWRHSRSTA